MWVLWAHLLLSVTSAIKFSEFKTGRVQEPGLVSQNPTYSWSVEKFKHAPQRSSAVFGVPTLEASSGAGAAIKDSVLAEAILQAEAEKEQLVEGLVLQAEAEKAELLAGLNSEATAELLASPNLASQGAEVLPSGSLASQGLVHLVETSPVVQLPSPVEAAANFKEHLEEEKQDLLGVSKGVGVVGELGGGLEAGWEYFKWPQLEEVVIEEDVPPQINLLDDFKFKPFKLGFKEDFKWPKFEAAEDITFAEEVDPEFGKLDWFKTPKVETVVLSEEEMANIGKFDLPKLELPKIEKGPIKEVPVYVYQLPSWPKPPKLDLPKIEAMKEMPLVLYEMPPLPEIEPLPEVKWPKIRIEKHILPPLPKLKEFKAPKIEPLKEIPIVMYEFPTPELKLPKIEPIKEIPIVMYELPPLPKMKPFPKIKLPEIKIIKKKLPALKPLKMPKLDFKLPEIKVVKVQAPPLELPKLKLPEVKFVKYDMGEKPKLPEFKLPKIKPLDIPKLPEFKLPEIKPIEWPKMPEIKPIELPKLPNIEFQEFYPMMMPQLQYMVAPAFSVPMPYPVSMAYHTKGFKHGFGGLKSKFGGTQIISHQPIIVNAGSSKTVGAGLEVLGGTAGLGVSGHVTEHIGQAGTGMGSSNHLSGTGVSGHVTEHIGQVGIGSSNHLSGAGHLPSGHGSFQGPIIGYPHPGQAASFAGHIFPGQPGFHQGVHTGHMPSGEAGFHQGSFASHMPSGEAGSHQGFFTGHLPSGQSGFHHGMFQVYSPQGQMFYPNIFRPQFASQQGFQDNQDISVTLEKENPAGIVAGSIPLWNQEAEFLNTPEKHLTVEGQVLKEIVDGVTKVEDYANASISARR